MLKKTIAAVVAVTTAVVAAPAFAASGRSDPIEDSYYPAQGDPGVDVLHYGLALKWQAATKVLQGVAKLHVRPTATAGGFQLALSHTLKVTRVTVDGHKSPHAHPGKTLHVTYPVTSDVPVKVKIHYHGTPKPVPAPTDRSDLTSIGWHTAAHGQVWAMQEPYGAFTWYPVNDTPSDKALYDVSIDAPKGFVGISNGRMTSRKKLSSGRTLTTFHNIDPIASYLVTIAIGNYRHHTSQGPNGLPMSFWVPAAHPGYMKPLKSTGSTLKWMEGRLGPYPFDRVGVVVVPSDSAIETQTMITLGSGNYRFGNSSVKQLVAHDLAHAWYGDSVTPKDWRDVWMNEGFATYLEARFSAYKGWMAWSKWQQEFTQNDGYWRTLYGPPGNYKKKDFGEINVRFCTARMLVRLRDTIGPVKFADVLRAWPQEEADSNRTRGGYIAWVNARTGRDLTDFFHTWLMSRTAPQ